MVDIETELDPEIVSAYNVLLITTIQVVLSNRQTKFLWYHVGTDFANRTYFFFIERQKIYLELM